jgi:hypothetical protein
VRGHVPENWEGLVHADFTNIFDYVVAFILNVAVGRGLLLTLIVVGAVIFGIVAWATDFENWPIWKKGKIPPSQ